MEKNEVADMKKKKKVGDDIWKSLTDIKKQ